MALNCIVDDSALLAGLNDPLNDNLQQWVREGLVNLFVPLYTLERLNMQRNQTDSPSSAAAQVVLQWLDYITSQTEGKNAGRVQLQGPDDQYQDWKDVERYLLPDTPLSSLTADTEDLAETLQSDLLLEEDNEADFTTGVTNSRSDENGSQRARSQTANVAPLNPNNPAGIPSQVRPLLNFVVWRTQKEDETLLSDRSNILLTEDPVTQKQASKFGVRAKLLHQVRGIVARDRQHHSGTGAMLDGGGSEVGGSTETGFAFWNKDEEDDEVVFDPTARPTSAQGGQDLIDPNHFGRSADNSFRGNNPRGRSRARGGRQSFGNSRGRTPTSPRSSAVRTRGAGGRSPRGELVALRGAPNETRGATDTPRPSSNRAQGGTAALRGGSASARVSNTSPQGQTSTSRGNNSTGGRRPGRGKGSALHIDPDSFDRPPPKGRRGRGTLWQPS